MTGLHELKGLFCHKITWKHPPHKLFQRFFTIQMLCWSVISHIDAVLEISQYWCCAGDITIQVLCWRYHNTDAGVDVSQYRCCTWDITIKMLCWRYSNTVAVWRYRNIDAVLEISQHWCCTGAIACNTVFMLEHRHVYIWRYQLEYFINFMLSEWIK